MYFFPDQELEAILAEDIPYGDLTARLLELEGEKGAVECFFKEEGVVAGVTLAERLFQKVGLQTERFAREGECLPARKVFLRATGDAAAIHAVYKTAQNIMEYASGIATRTRAMVVAARKGSPRCRVVTTRKHFPGAKRLSLFAVECGGGLVHRTGLSESILIFDQHRVFTKDFARRLTELHTLDPERKIAVEIETVEAGLEAARGGADILQCDKMSVENVARLTAVIRAEYPGVLVSAAGGVKAENAESYAAAGADFLVTSWPYFGRPHDVKMRMITAGRESGSDEGRS